MVFEIDVLLIFADRDNEPSGKTGEGWVTNFKKFLEVMLEQVLGAKPKILLKAEYDTMVSPRLDNAGVLLAILSKNFVQSAACMESIEKFFSASAPQEGRVFKVFKSPLLVQEQPARLRELFGYDMYEADAETGEIRDFADYFGSEAERQYWMEIVDLSYDVCETLLALKNGKTAREVKTIFHRKTVYLAQTCHDLSVSRNILHRELQRLGYSVLPSQSLPGELVDLERLVRRDLSTSSMSIHLIGADYGETPSGSDRSIQDLQHKLAEERGVVAKENREDFSRLIWITTDLTHANDRQKRFIETLRRDVETQEGAEILQTLLEDFKNIIREELEDASEKKVLDETNGRAIYLIYDKVDHEEIKPFAELIRNTGFTVLVPEFEGELLDLRQRHVEHLRNLDGAIIYKGKVNEQWTRVKAMDLLKAPGFGRKKPILGKAILVSPGSLLNKDSYKSLNLQVIEGELQHSLESLRLFLQELKG